MSVLRLLFHRGIGTTAIEKLLSELGTFEWTRVFMENERLYVMRIPSEQLDTWKDVLTQLPEVELVASVGNVRIVRDRIA